MGFEDRPEALKVKGEKVTIERVVPKEQKVIVVEKTATIHDLLNLLKKHGIHSCPVVDETGDCIGLVDYLDALSFTMQVDREIETKQWKNYMMKFSFVLNTVDKICDLSERNPYITHVTKEDSIYKLCYMLGYERIHRICLVEEKKVKSVITQSHAFRYMFDIEKGIFAEETWFKELLKTKVQDHDIGVQKEKGGNLIHVKPKETAIKAFETMNKHKKSALAVVNEKGHIVGNMSASQLRGFLDDDFNMLGDTVNKFIDYALKKQGLEVQDIVFVMPQFTIKHVIQEIIKHDVSRVYIVAKDKKPVGVITMSDLFHLVYTLAKE